MVEVIIDNDQELGFDHISDVEAAFKTVRLTGTETERSIIHSIDNATYLSETSFKDRFGYKLHMSELSTGCKAALVTLHNQETWIRLIECGDNARDAILCLIDRCKVIMGYNDVTIDYKKYGKENCNVLMGKYLFKKFDRLNVYLDHEMPYDPSLRIGGVEIV